MNNSRIPITASIESIEKTKSRVEEAAYYTWLSRSRYAQPGDEMSDWIEAERSAQKGQADVPSAT